jgi:hypothetical protein
MKVKKTSVSITEIDEKIVNDLATQRGMSFSAALRFIIREWLGSQDGTRFRLTEKGEQVVKDLKG